MRLSSHVAPLVRLLFGCLSLTAFVTFGQTDRYVSSAGSAPNDGTSWAAAFTTIQAALDAAGTSNTIHVAGETFTLTAPLTWTVDGLTLRGGYQGSGTPGAYDPDLWPTVVTRHSANLIRLVDLANLDGATITGITFTGGFAQKTLADAWDAQGGALRAVNVTGLAVANCRFTDNRAEGITGQMEAYGGAVYLSGGSARFEVTRFADNIVWATGNNGYGGALYATGAGSLELDACRLTGNRIETGTAGGNAYGGAVALVSIADATVSASLFHRNQIGERNCLGGGFYALNSAGDIVQTQFLGNRNLGSTAHSQVGFGGALHIEGGAWTIAHSVVFGNELRGRNRAGDGIYLHSGSHTLRNLLIAANRALYDVVNGALYIATGPSTVENVTIAYHSGLGLRATAADTVRNTIIYGNRTQLSGAPSQVNNLIGVDPLFEFPLFYLDPASPAVGVGDRSASDAGLGALTSFVDGTNYADPDNDPVNLGYHFDEGLVLDLELWVDSVNGDDGNDGTALVPLRSITRAIEIAAPRTRVNLAAGHYTTATETFPLRIEEKTVKLIGAGRDATVIDAAGSNARVYELVDSPLGDNRLEGLTLRGGYNGQGIGGGLYTQLATLTLEDAAVRNNEAKASGVFGGGLYALQTIMEIRRAWFTGNVANGSTTSGAPGHGGGVAFISGAAQFDDSIIIGNFVYSRTVSGGGIYLDEGYYRLRNLLVANNVSDNFNATASGSGIRVQAKAVTTIENATIHGHTEDGLSTGATDTVLRNSIVARNVPDIGGNPTLEHNLIGDGTADGIDGNFKADPKLELPLLYLAPDSPAVGAGSVTAASAGVTGRTSFRNGGSYTDPDNDPVNLGFHFAAGVPAIDVELWVDPASGDDGNPGTAALPLESITRALELAGAVTRVHLAPGNYVHGVETFPLNAVERTVQLIGTDRETTIIDADGANTRVLRFADDPLGENRIERVTIRKGNIANQHGGGIYAENVALSIRDSALRDNQARLGSPRRGGGLYAERCGLVIERTLFKENRAETGTASGNLGVGGGIFLLGGHSLIDRVTLVGNTVHGRNSTGAGLAMLYGYLELRNALIYGGVATGTDSINAAGIRLFEGSIFLENCTVADNVPEGLRRDSVRVNLTVYNAIFWGNTVNDLAGTVDQSKIFHSLAANLIPNVQGNLDSDPLFIDPAQGDYRLKSQFGQIIPDGSSLTHAVTSPAIDAGVNRPWMTGATDLQGMPRVVKSLPTSPTALADMGAYEISAPPLGTLLLIR